LLDGRGGRAGRRGRLSHAWRRSAVGCVDLARAAIHQPTFDSDLRALIREPATYDWLCMGALCATLRIVPLMLQAGFCPTRARTKKPASGNPGTGAHFVSFNFLNSPISLPKSRGHNARNRSSRCRHLTNASHHETALSRRLLRTRKKQVTGVMIRRMG
jgi:hypothetical protein